MIIELKVDCEIPCRDARGKFTIVKLKKGDRFHRYSNDGASVYATIPNEVGAAADIGKQYLIPKEYAYEVRK